MKFAVGIRRENTVLTREFPGKYFRLLSLPSGFPDFPARMEAMEGEVKAVNSRSEH